MQAMRAEEMGDAGLRCAMKPVRAWAIVNGRGDLVVAVNGTPVLCSTRAGAIPFEGECIVRVEIREVERAKPRGHR